MEHLHIIKYTHTHPLSLQRPKQQGTVDASGKILNMGIYTLTLTFKLRIQKKYVGLVFCHRFSIIR